MREVELWQRMSGGDDSPQVAAALAEHVGRDLDGRAALLPVLGPWLEAEAAERRCIAVMLLAGCTGMLALGRLVAALDDDDDTVRAAAVMAFATSCAAEPMRWAHALFHARADVRRLAAAATPDAARVLLPWCWADPDLAPWCADAPWPADPIALIHDLWRRGRLAPEAALRGLAQCSAEAIREFVTRAEARGPAQCAAFLRAAVGATTCPAIHGEDALDALLDMIDGAGASGALGVLVDAMHGAERDGLRRRVLVSVCAAAARRGWSPALARLAFDASPAWLAFEFVPLEVRVPMLERVWSPGGELDAVPPELVHALMQGPIIRGADGAPRLSRLAALAALLPARRVRSIVDALTEPAAIRLSADDPVGWSAVARLDPESAHLWWLERVAELRPDAALRCRALLWLRWLARGDARALDRDGPFVSDPVALAEGLFDLDVQDGLAQAIAVLRPALAPAPAPWLSRALACTPAQGLAHALLGAAIEHDAVAFARLAIAAGTVAMEQAIDWLDRVLAPGEAQLTRIVTEWRAVTHPRVAAFVARSAPPPTPAPRAPVVGPRRLAAAHADRIASCGPDELDDALACALEAPSFGLTDALARRVHVGPSLSVAVALLGCVDGLVPVARELARFGSDAPEFVEGLRYATATLWRESDAVPPLVDAVLVAFDRNAEGLATWFESEDGGYARVLEDALDLPSSLATQLLWNGIAGVLTVWSWRDRGRRLADGFTGALATRCVDLLDTQLGPMAARILVAGWRAKAGRGALERLRPRVVGLAPGCTQRTHDALSPWISLRGVAPRDRPARLLVKALPADERLELGASSDVARLVRACELGGEASARAAVLRLVELGAPGQFALAAALAGELRQVELAIESIAHWTSRPALVAVAAITADPEVDVERRVRIALALALRGEPDALATALALCADPRAGNAARPDDWSRLLACAPDPRALAVAAVHARDPVLADPALAWLLEHRASASLAAAITSEGGASLRLRRAAAVAMLEDGDARGIALVLRWLTDPDVPSLEAEGLFTRVVDRGPPAWTDALVDLALVGGSAVATEARVVELLTLARPEVRDAGFGRLLLDGRDPASRKRIVAGRMNAPGRDAKLVELATTFAWGVMRGRELTGRRFTIHMTPKREQWGFTHLEGTSIHVTPVPILARARHGRDIVEGLILHEIGHHVWHAGKLGARVWRRAQKEHLHQLLNLVADEHLERNLRSIDADFGDRIKRLDAHAFQHAAREIPVLELLPMLRGAALEVLGQVGPQPAYEPACLRIDSGRLLSRLDASGHSFARFVRALRMGLGNRSGDPKVERALTYFGAEFRGLDMNGLMRVTRELAALFGTDALLAHGFGGHESVAWNERDSDLASDGIRDAEVQREVERILEPPRPSPNPGGGGGLVINVGAADRYKKITNVQKLPPSAARHAALATTVGRYAGRLRETLERLGLGHVVTRGRLRGHALDRSRVRAVVTRGEPRMLQAREVQVRSDLFLGVVVDCSGSMSGANLERARRFAVLVAEAARGLAGVDARFFGFTDQVIWDAGDARRCAVASLEASGGNNDAAALDHVARVAAASRRRARLIVMISDGLPTECSVSALKAVVRELGRRHRMCCAQVAVRPLSEICFPNYVLLDDANLDAAVRRFAELIARLVGRALTM